MRASRALAQTLVQVCNVPDAAWHCIVACREPEKPLRLGRGRALALFADVTPLGSARGFAKGFTVVE